jgi:hypothetical protein
MDAGHITRFARVDFRNDDRVSERFWPTQLGL